MKEKNKTYETKNKVFELYKMGNFGKVVSTIEEEFDPKRMETILKKVYAFSLIRIGDISSAQHILEEVLEEYPEDSEVLNALAYIHITRGNKTAAINYLLDAEYYAQGDIKEKIKKNLSLLSEIPEISTLRSVIKPKDFLVLSLPTVSHSNTLLETFRTLLSKVNVKTAAIVTGIIAGTLILYIVLTLLQGEEKKDITTENIKRIEIESNTELVEPKPVLTNEITLSEREIYSLFNEIKILLSRNRSSNKARFIANYLLLSNASAGVKNKVEVLKTFMEEPEVNLDWQPLYEEVISKPVLYDGVYVLWKGKIVNVLKTGKAAEFTFVIQGKEESVVKGFIKARMREFLDGYVGQTVTILGKLSVSKDIVLDVVRVVE